MPVRYTNSYLHKLEDILSESSYILRYEKGNFKSGYCILKDTKVVIVNKYFPLDGKVNCLIDIISELRIDKSHLSKKNASLVAELTQTVLKL